MPATRRGFLGAAGCVTGAATGASILAGAADRDSDPDHALDWPMARYDPAGTAHNPDVRGPKDGVEIAWAHDATDWFLGTASPIRVGDAIYAVGEGLLALDSQTGERRFGFPGPYRSSPARVESPIYRTATLAASGPGGIVGLNAGGGVDLPLIDRTIGGTRWTGQESPPPGLLGDLGLGLASADEPTTPTSADGTIYAAVPETDRLVAISPTDGSTHWAYTPPQEESWSSPLTRPAVDDGMVYSTAYPSLVVAVDAATGAHSWKRTFEDDQVTAPISSDAGIVVQTRERVRLLDATTGETLWGRDLDTNVTDCTPAVADGTIYAPGEWESLYALDLETGETEWSRPFKGESAPVVADGVVYAVRSGYQLVAMDAATGETRFTYEPEQVPLSPPIVGDRVLYATNRRRVVALQEAV